MNRLGVAIFTFTMSVAPATGLSAPQNEASPSPAPSAVPQSTTSAPSQLDEQTCVDPGDQLLWPLSAHGKTVGDVLDCAKALGLKKGDPDYPAYDFTLMKRTESREGWTQQCNEAGTHIGSRYHASGTDTLYRDDKPKRAVSGTFDFTVVSTLIDPEADTWRVEKQGDLWDVHSSDGDLGWTWSVEMTTESDGTPDTPQLEKYRGVERDAFGVFCEYLK